MFFLNFTQRLMERCYGATEDLIGDLAIEGIEMASRLTDFLHQSIKRLESVFNSIPPFAYSLAIASLGPQPGNAAHGAETHDEGRYRS